MEDLGLLTPRVKVLAIYPSCSFKVGQILTFNKVTPYSDRCCNESEMAFQDYSRYPHLFKILDWWEERSLTEMPDHIKVRLDKDDPSAIWITSVEETVEYFENNGFEQGDLPATKEEYDNYKKAQRTERTSE